jgi:hypothetical protein
MKMTIQMKTNMDMDTDMDMDIDINMDTDTGNAHGLRNMVAHLQDNFVTGSPYNRPMSPAQYCRHTICTGRPCLLQKLYEKQTISCFI